MTSLCVACSGHGVTLVEGVYELCEACEATGRTGTIPTSVRGLLSECVAVMDAPFVTFKYRAQLRTAIGVHAPAGPAKKLVVPTGRPVVVHEPRCYGIGAPKSSSVVID